jgi:hypothetical protein
LCLCMYTLPLLLIIIIPSRPYASIDFSFPSASGRGTLIRVQQNPSQASWGRKETHTHTRGKGRSPEPLMIFKPTIILFVCTPSLRETYSQCERDSV